MSGASDSEAQEFAARFVKFLEWVHTEERKHYDRNEVVELISGFLGETAAARSVVTRQLALFDHVNLQAALNAWSTEPGRKVEIYGISIPPHHGVPNLQQIITGTGVGHMNLCPPPLVDLANGPGSTLACLNFGLLLVEDEAGRYVVMVAGPVENERGLAVHVGGLDVQAAQAVHARLAKLRNELNVYRGHLLEVAFTPGAGVSLQFTQPAELTRSDVILPEAVLARVERHALGIAEYREQLLAAGQHLKRGLLLYGPPGTGKTHTTRYLLSTMTGYTRFVLTGRALQAVGSVTELARDLEPSALVLEDVDLVAEHRTAGPASSPILFDLLDAMDGAAPDADLLFLEPALAARPGRVDVAVEVELPDAEARARLLTLYSRSLSLGLSEAETATVIERTEGVTASFLKELLRRAVLEAMRQTGGSAQSEINAEHMSAALDDLLDSSQGVTRSLLGVGNDPGNLPGGGGAGSLPREGQMIVGRGRRIYNYGS
jgi:hypothetical protein